MVRAKLMDRFGGFDPRPACSERVEGKFPELIAVCIVSAGSVTPVSSFLGALECISGIQHSWESGRSTY